MTETLLNRISKYPNNTIISDAWITGQTGEIVDLQGNCEFRFIDYIDSPELRQKHTTIENKLACPIIACGLVGYWLHKKDSEGTRAIFEGYYELCLKEYEKAHEKDDDAWERDLKKEFVCRYHIISEKKRIQSSEALFAYITESDKKKVKGITDNYLRFARAKRLEQYPDEIDSEAETPQSNYSDFEHLKVWQDNPILDYYLSENHWNYHVNTLLYKNLLVFHKGKELGAFLDVQLDNYTQPIKDYTSLYGNLFNEAYRLCKIVFETPVPQTKIVWFANQAATWKFKGLKDEDGNSIELAPNVTDLIESYHILGMVNAILTFSNVQKDIINEFLIALSVYNDNGLFFCGAIHCFELYNDIYEAFILANMVNGSMLRPGYDHNSRDKYLRKNIPWYNHLAVILEKEKQKAKEKKKTSLREQNNNKCNVFNGPVTIIKNRSSNHHQDRRSDFWFDFNNRMAKNNTEKSESYTVGKTCAKQGEYSTKETRFTDYIVDKEKADQVISIINKKINSNDAKQTAYVIIGGIEAGKIHRSVSAPSIEREFGVKGNSIKPHLTKYRSYKDGKSNSFSEEELKPYKELFSEI
jgi:hypothetical protein